MSIHTTITPRCPVLVAVDHIAANLSESIRLSDLVAVSQMSRYHFVRSFREVTGVTPMRFVTERRVDAAKALLTVSTRSLCSIALDCGFSSHAHFCTVFRSVTGVTPSRWRDCPEVRDNEPPR